MTAKKFFQSLVIITVLVVSLASTSSALAGGNCASYITVQWGDTLSELAAACGTTVESIQAANPNLGWWLYAGEVLYIPTGSPAQAVPAPAYQPQAGNTYVVQWGDTLGSIAAQKSVSLSDILAVNPNIWNINFIYPGQVINLPASVTVIVVTTAPPPAYIPVPPLPQYGKLKISYGFGMAVRTGPGKQYAVIQSPLVSAVKDSTWEYRKDSTSIDSNGYVWVEVKLNPLAPYSTGWILVRDTLGKYYTEPMIDP